MPEPKAIVVIPVYKSSFNKYEIISLRSCLNKLSSHCISILCPASKIDAVYTSVCSIGKPPQSAKLRIHSVPDTWLSSHMWYNKLMLSRDFYDFYRSEFTHVLISQLDSYVFDDRLIDWCKAGYSYIGAPIKRLGRQDNSRLKYVIGCGGFSLRHIDSFLKILVDSPTVLCTRDYCDILSSYSFKGKISRLTNVLTMHLTRGTRLAFPHNRLNDCLGILEDMCYGYYIPKLDSSFTVPSIHVASQFSLDTDVEYFINNTEAIPFGVHSWWTNKTNLAFWSKYVDVNAF